LHIIDAEVLAFSEVDLSIDIKCQECKAAFICHD